MAHGKKNIDDYNNVGNERGENSRAGGGFMAYWRSELSVHPHYVEVGMKYKKLDTEWQWLLLVKANQSFAICNVYLRAEVPACPDFKDHYDLLLEMLMLEIVDLRNKGFHILLIGDFNAHIGNDWYGALSNNRRDVNSNGRRVREFITINHFEVLNSREVQGRVFTREGRTSDEVSTSS